MKVRNIFLALAFAALSAFGADVDGKWAGTIQSPNGGINLFFTFKADGTTLTGTMIGPDGAEIKISDGKIEGDKISFNTAVEFNGQAMTLSYTGTVAGENLALTLNFNGMPVPVALKKTAA